MSDASAIFACVVDGANPDEPISVLLDRLIAGSERCAVIQQGRMCELRGAEQISGILKRQNERTWIMTGSFRRADSRAPSSDPCIVGLGDIGLGNERLLEELLRRADWAFFSMFSTYQTRSYCLVSVQAEQARQIVAYPTRLISHYTGSAPILPNLHYLTYQDDGVEGLLPFELALARGEPEPLVLVRISQHNPEFYRSWDDELDVPGADEWYEKYLSRLTLEKEFGVIDGASFRLYRADNVDAYMGIWARPSYENAIAEATFSSDCDIEKLDGILRESSRVDAIKDAAMLGNWTYTTVYGGGADEHHALFYSRAAGIAQAMWEAVGTDAIARF